MFVFVFRLRWLRRGCASDLRKAADRRVKMERESREPARAVIAANRVLSVHHQTNLSPPRPSRPLAHLSPKIKIYNVEESGTPRELSTARMATGSMEEIRAPKARDSEERWRGRWLETRKAEEGREGEGGTRERERERKKKKKGKERKLLKTSKPTLSKTLHSKNKQPPVVGTVSSKLLPSSFPPCQTFATVLKKKAVVRSVTSPFSRDPHLPRVAPRRLRRGRPSSPSTPPSSIRT